MPNPYPLEILFGRVLSPFERFLQRTTAGGLILVGTTVLALLLAAILGGDKFHHFWDGQTFLLNIGNLLSLKLTWHHVVNDGLMALFFLLVGLELKREVLVGELSSLRDAALPVIAAIGGMVVPALIYAGFNMGSATSNGWGVPMATDIAFAIGILVLLAWRIPKNLIIFLTALAIADDLGAVLVIAIFYSSGLDWNALSYVAGLILVLALFNRGGIRHPLPYAVLGVLLWYFLLTSGVHATLAGIFLAAAIPARPAHSAEEFDERLKELQEAFHEETGPHSPNDPLRNERMASLAENLEHSANAVQSPLQRIEHALSPWVTFLIIPIFAMANAGIDLGQINFSSAFSERLTLGIIFGLVVGKFFGITFFSWLAVKAGIAQLPVGVGWKHLTGAAWLGGIGFTMSLFVAQLAFKTTTQMEQAKLGILVASLISAIVGLCWLIAVSRKQTAAPTVQNPD